MIFGAVVLGADPRHHGILVQVFIGAPRDEVECEQVVEVGKFAIEPLAHHVAFLEELHRRKYLSGEQLGIDIWLQISLDPGDAFCEVDTLVGIIQEGEEQRASIFKQQLHCVGSQQELLEGERLNFAHLP